MASIRVRCHRERAARQGGHAACLQQQIQHRLGDRQPLLHPQRLEARAARARSGSCIVIHASVTTASASRTALGGSRVTCTRPPRSAASARAPLLFQTGPCARATLHTPEGPGRLTPDQGLPDMAFAVT
jgi:hypothetical protein